VSRTIKKPVGSVAFVGAGPAGPDLLTVRGARLLATAEVVVLGPGDHAAFLDLCRDDVEVLEVAAPDGTRPGTAARAKTVVDAAKAGARVVRLVDGDPFLFGGATEEAAACTKAHVPVEVVPGVAVASAVPLFAGVPLTSEDSSDVRVVDVAAGKVDWDSLAVGDAALVLLGATPALDAVASALVAGGRKPGTPVAVTAAGGSPAQRTVAGTLADIAATVRAAGLPDDAVTMVGGVVGQRAKHSWFETKPLFGWRVLVPRTKEQAGALSAQLATYGAVPEEVPTIAVEPPRSPQQMERSIKGLVTGRYEWIAFTSRNAVKAVHEKFDEFGLDSRAFAGIKVAAVGEQTAADLRAWGINPDLVPSSDQSVAGLLEEWPPYDPVFDPIDRVFLPRADIATETLVAGLIDLGWEVDDVTAYRTVRAAPPAAEIREAIKGGGFDAVLFTSSSTVRNLVAALDGRLPEGIRIVSIGPVTSDAAREAGLTVNVEAERHDIDGLIEALLADAATSPTPG
jgi:uroporphyrinogen III methyltransferase / synthase